MAEQAAEMEVTVGARSSTSGVRGDMPTQEAPRRLPPPGQWLAEVGLLDCVDRFTRGRTRTGTTS